MPLLFYYCYVSSVSPSRKSSDSEGDGSVDVSPAHDGRNDSGVLSKNLDSLSKEQARILCIQTKEMSDPCAAVGVKQATEAECREYIQTCRDQSGSVDMFGSCNDTNFGEPGSCSLTQQEYLDCYSAYDSLHNCDNAGKTIIAPEQCYDVTARCEFLAQSFGRMPEPIAQCEETGDERGRAVDDKDIYGAEGCFPRPARMVVLGDSLSDCISYVEAIDDCSCTWKRVASYIRHYYAPDLVAEGRYPKDELRGNIRDVAEDAKRIMGGPGHILVYISCIGWDLLDLPGESNRLEDLDEAMPTWLEDWQRLFDYFTDQNRFPDGATFMLNTLYSPTDDCPQSDKDTLFTTLTEEEEQIVRRANEKILLEAALQRPDTVAMDIYPDWLGHGHNFDVSTCPHYSPDNDWWMSDPLHPNNIGYQHMANKWKRAIDRMYGEDCL